MVHLVLLTLLLLIGTSAAAGAQEPPRFQSGVELLRVHVSVTDSRGPVRDLRAEDFTVLLDGKPRPVRFAQFYEPAEASVPAAQTAAPLPSYAVNTSTPSGRVVVLAVDLFALKQGYEKLVLDAAAKLVDSLGASDAVGLMPITGKGVDLTRDHRLVSDALRTLRGSTNVPFVRHYFTIKEAVQFEQNERRVIGEVIERECTQKDYTCPTELRDETREMLAFARQHVTTVLTNLAKLADVLQSIDAPKTIILVSAGLPFEMETFNYFTGLQRSLARSGTMIYSVQVNQPDNDASNLRAPGVGTYQAADLQTGLANVATIGGGTLFPAIGTAAGAFDRLRAEVAYSYELAVDGAPTDADGKAHDVKVTVRRPGTTVRASREVIVRPGEGAHGKRLGTLLAQPVDRAELPMAVAAYAVRGGERDTLKVIVSGEMAAAVAPTDYALVIIKDGAVTFQTNGRADQAHDGARTVLAAQLAPGRYRIRLAAVDGAGRGGTVELPMSVGLRALGTLQTSDLIVGTEERVFRPSVTVAAGTALTSLLELYSVDPTRFSQLSIRCELRRGETVLAEAPAQLDATDSDRRRLAQGRLHLPDLAPGEYLVSAVVSEDGRPTGRISRAIKIVPAGQ